MKKKIISVILCCVMLVSLLPQIQISASAATSGTDGNIEWSLDDSGKLTISGSGAMPDYSGVVPWFSWRSEITKIEVCDGITSIGRSAFSYCENLTSITLPDSVTSIGLGAFMDCYSLASITIPNGVTSIGSLAFTSCVTLTSISIPEKVTSIGSSAFLSCDSLTSINVADDNGYYCSDDGVLFDKEKTELICYPAGKTEKTYIVPNSVTRIEFSAFSYCENLSSITIPNGVRSIPAFVSCNNLTKITVADENGYYCSEDGVLFNEGKTKIICYPAGRMQETYTIPNGVTYIGDSAFSGCESLTSITIPNGVTSIERSAFSDCVGLTAVTIADSVTSIGDSAFFGCTALASITIPNGLTSINFQAFSMCTSLASITLPDGLTSIGDSAFSGCESLSSIALPDGLTSIDGSAFEGCRSLRKITLPDSVTNIGGRAFLGCESLTSITIPNGVTSIGYGTFYDCLSLRSIMLPDSITSIEQSAFFGCYSLSSITIPNSVTSIGDQAFVYCDSLKNVYYGGSRSDWAKISIGSYNDSLTTAKIYFEGEEATDIVASGTDGNIEWAFDDVGTLTISGMGAMPDYTYPSRTPWYSLSSEIVKVEVCDGVASIGNDAFIGCQTLKSITLPDSVTSIGESAFAACINLATITIPEGVKCIKEGTFNDCQGLISVLLPNGLTDISDWAFNGCESLSSITLPDSVTSIGNGAFNRCYSLTTITMPNSVTHIGDSAFNGCESLSSITLPDSVTSIGVGAFCRCYSLTSITIPDSVTHIGDSVFDSCASLSSITIPSSVTSIGDYAFFWCDSLTNVYYGGKKSEWGKITIGQNNDPLTSATIHFAKAPAITYSFGQSVQLGLIEPWFLKANLLVYTTSTSNPIDYDTLKDYGAYFIRASELADPKATQDSLSVEDIINNENAVKRSKKEGSATIDGKFLTAKYDDGIYTYEMSDSIFVLFYVEDEHGIQYAPIRERNIKSLLEARKDDAANFPNELERKVYSAMLEMYEAVTAYREDYYSKN